MKNIINIYRKFAHWVDYNLGDFLTNPNNIHRWKKRHKL